MCSNTWDLLAIKPIGNGPPVKPVFYMQDRNSSSFYLTLNGSLGEDMFPHFLTPGEKLYFVLPRPHFGSDLIIFIR